MIPDIDEVLRKLLIREIPIRDNEVDVVFDQPKREWSSRLNKPTINLFLFDLRENLRLRGSEQYTTKTLPNGTTEVRRNPVRMDLRYLMTVWVKEPEDEHLLLASSLLALLRNPFLPNDLLTERLQAQPTPIILDVATFPPEIGPIDKFSEMWGVLDNEMHPGVLLTITISMDPYQPMIYTQVAQRETRFIQTPGPAGTSTQVSLKATSKARYAVSGSVKSERYDTSTLSLILVERQAPIEINQEGKYTIQNLTEGEYHLDVLYNKKILKRHKITVPAQNYDIQL